MAQPGFPRWLPKVFLLFFDVVGVVVTFNLAYLLRFGASAPAGLLGPNLLAVVVVILVVNYVLDLSNFESRVWGLRTPARFLLGVMVSGVVTAVLLYISAERAAELFGRGVLVMGLALYGVLGATGRYLLGEWTRARVQARRWLVLADESVFTHLLDDLSGSSAGSTWSLPMAFLLPRPGDSPPHLKKPGPVIGSWEDLAVCLKEGRDAWAGVIVATQVRLPEGVMRVLMPNRLSGLRVYSLTDFYEMVWQKVPVFSLDYNWFVFSEGFVLLHNPIGLRLKRLTDILGALVLLPLVLPVMVLAIPLLMSECGRHFIFRQTRTGRHGEPFTLFKFRTMRMDAERDGAQWAKANDPRVTFWGRLFRKTRIDELPQLFNVLRGDMSFIGPRPERPEFVEELEKAIPYYSLRTLVRPGITGWAQVLYPYGASVADAVQKLQLDLYYIKNYSLFLDLRIILKTVRTVVLGSGR